MKSRPALLITLSFCFIISIAAHGQSIQWMPLPGVFGGGVFDFAESPDGNLYAATSRGIFLSANGGESWTTVNPDLILSYSEIEVNPNGDLFTSSFVLLRSTDGGLSWQELNNGIPANRYTIRINGSRIFAFGGIDYLYRSTDNGDSWTQLTTGLTVPSFEDMAFNSNGDIFLGGVRGTIFKSIDNGDTWTTVYADTNLSNTVMTLTIDENDRLFAGTWRDGLLRSTDNGATWHYVNNGLTAAGINALTHLSNGALLVSCRFDGGGVFYSDNQGDNWQPWTSGLADSVVFNLKTISGNTVLAGCADGGVFRLQMGQNAWQPGNDGLAATFISKLIHQPDGKLFAIGADGIFSSSDFGETWHQHLDGLTERDIQALAFTPSGQIFAGSDGAIFVSPDSGRTWQNATGNFPDHDVNAQDLAVTSNGQIFVATDEYGVARSTDGGQSWQMRNNGIQDSDVDLLAVNGNDMLFASDGFNVYRSADFGENWTIVNNGLTDTDAEVFGIAADNTLYAGSYSDGLFRSANNGDLWELVLDRDISFLAPGAGPELYAASYSQGVFYSADNGLTWVGANDGLPGLQMEALALDNQQHLFTITRSGALYRADLATGIEPGEGEDLFLSRTFQLRQNYPNPFNPETLIEFHLPTASHVRLTVFNTLGQVVKVLVDQTRQAGPHQVRWNATDQNDRSVASGPYFYRLESSGKAISKSMLLLR